MDKQAIAEIENQHWQLLNAYKTEPALKSALDVYGKSTITSFDTAWAIPEGSVDILQDFCRRIAIVYTNTASVESDFSILGWEKNALVSIIYYWFVFRGHYTM